MTDAGSAFQDLFAACAHVAMLQGFTLDEPEPMCHAPSGATILMVGQVAPQAEAGGTLTVVPDTPPGVICASVAAGLVARPGDGTPSGAFAEIDVGLHRLTHFPADSASPAVPKAQSALLTKEMPVPAVGRITTAWLAAGAGGLRPGPKLHGNGASGAAVAVDAAAFVDAAQVPR
jgi:2-keto-3-deoxy-6-phosphogluconate aldolase